MLALALAGGLAGLISGLFGIGGGIVMVPVLFWYLGTIFTQTPQLIHFAVATSLAMIVLNATISFLTHQKYGSIDLTYVRRWAIYIALGGLLGGYAAPYIPSIYLTGLFALFTLGISAHMLLFDTSRTMRPTSRKGMAQTLTYMSSLPLLIGFLSALMGIGGGTLSVPALLDRGVSMPRAVGTSSFFGAMIALFGLIGFGVTQTHSTVIMSNISLPFCFGFIYLPALIFMVPTASFLAPVGVKLSHKINSLWLRRAFGILLGLSALRMLTSLF